MEYNFFQIVEIFHDIKGILLENDMLLKSSLFASIGKTCNNHS
jgi:hypothetical protein